MSDHDSIESLKMRIAIDSGMLAHLMGNEPAAKTLANIAGALRQGPTSGLLAGNTTPVVPLAAVMRELTAQVSEETGYTIEELRGRGRDRWLSWSRFECWARIYDTGGISLPQIGRYFDRDHSTILSGIRRAKLFRAQRAADEERVAG
jgi:hypothetical protein